MDTDNPLDETKPDEDPKKGARRGSDQPLPGKCGAKLRKSDPPRYCAKSPLENGRCMFHGGKSLKGTASPLFKNGMYSKYMPEDLREGYENSRKDPDLLSLKDSIRILRAFVTRRLKKMQELEFPAWTEAAVLFQKMVQTGDPIDVNNLGQLLQEGLTTERYYESAIEDIRNVTQELERVTVAEHKMEMDKKVYVHQTEVTALIKATLDAIKVKVTDEAARVAVLQYIHENAWRGLALPKPEPEVIDAEIVE